MSSEGTASTASSSVVTDFLAVLAYELVFFFAVGLVELGLGSRSFGGFDVFSALLVRGFSRF